MTEDWYEADDHEADDDESTLVEYDITASPNDFNTKTIFDFIESGSVKIPAFQRNYVWDIRRASRLIESLVIGIPVPQVFLYEEARNRFLVIDGQQRLMSIYYFIKQRFPAKEKRAELRRIFDQNASVPDEVLHDDKYFTNFRLALPRRNPDVTHPLHGMSYATLDEYKSTFDLRTIRNILIKQLRPSEDDSSIYELFNRLNTGGVNLTPQEIRVSLYHSSFYNMLHRANASAGWRKMTGLAEPDLRMKDVEFLLRGFAMLADGNDYKPSMARFLNRFSMKAKKFPEKEVERLAEVFAGFLAQNAHLSPTSFFGKTGRRFNISMFEAVFTAACGNANVDAPTTISEERIKALREDDEFAAATKSKAGDRSVVLARLGRAKKILLG